MKTKTHDYKITATTTDGGTQTLFMKERPEPMGDLLSALIRNKFLFLGDETQGVLLNMDHVIGILIEEDGGEENDV